MRFENKILFVTGGASGIGRATAARVVAEGGRAAIVDLAEGEQGFDGPEGVALDGTAQRRHVA